VNRVRVTRALEIGAAGVAAIFVLAFGVIATLRLRFPFELSWSESAMGGLVAARTLGRPMYTAPSIFDGVSCLYPPLFSDLSALVARLFESDSHSTFFLPMRLVSVVSCAGIFIGTLWILRRRRALTWAMAVALAAIFPASYGRMDFWHDIARVDSLFTFLVFASTAVLLEGTTLWSAALAGVFGGLATLTKQPALLLLGLAGFDTVFVKRQYGRALAFAVAFAVLVLGYLWSTGELVNPWFYYWILKTAGSRSFLSGNLLLGPLFVLLVIPFAVFFAGTALVFRYGSRGKATAAVSSQPQWSWSLVFGLWTLLSLILRAKDGGSINYFMPSISVGAMAIVEGAQWLARRGLDGRRIAGFAALAQLAILSYDPTLFLPTSDAVKEASHLAEILNKVDGPIWFPSYSSYATLAGKPWVTHYGTLTDIEATNPGRIAGEIALAIKNRHFGAIILHPTDSFVDRNQLSQFYEPQQFPTIHSPFLRRSLYNFDFGTIFVRKQPTAP
jgi:hypothetical protein